MMKKKKTFRQERAVDRHLDAPAEANRDKHINYVAREGGDRDPAAEPDSGKLLKREKDRKKNSGSD